MLKSLNCQTFNLSQSFYHVQKRKLSDMLGSQWSKEELERFYEAYRKHGKDWKKVSTYFIMVQYSPNKKKKLVHFPTWYSIFIKYRLQGN